MGDDGRGKPYADMGRIEAMKGDSILFGILAVLTVVGTVKIVQLFTEPETAEYVEVPPSAWYADIWRDWTADLYLDPPGVLPAEILASGAKLRDTRGKVVREYQGDSTSTRIFLSFKNPEDGSILDPSYGTLFAVCQETGDTLRFRFGILEEGGSK